MPDYKTLYLQLLSNTTTAIEKLKQARTDVEDTFIAYDEDLCKNTSADKKFSVEPLSEERAEKILQKIRTRIDNIEQYRKEYDIHPRYDLIKYKGYTCVYEPFSEDCHQIEPKCQEYFDKFLSEDEKVLYHFISIPQFNIYPYTHLYFTSKQMINFLPITECSTYNGMRHLEFMPYSSINFRGMVGPETSKKGSLLGLELCIQNIDTYFFDFLPESLAIDLTRLINNNM